MKSIFSRSFIVLFLYSSGAIANSTQAAQSSLALGDRTGAPDTSISVPVQIASDGGLVGLQFDILFNNAQIDITSITPAPLATDHAFTSKTITDGLHRVLVYSVTNTEFENGVIGNLELDLGSSFPEGVASLSLSNVSFVTADGTILNVDIAPFVQLTDPTTSLSADELDTLDLSAIAIENVGAISRVEFQVDGRTVAFDSEGPYSASWVVDAPGNVLLTAVAIDENGMAGTSPGVLIDVTASPFLDAWRQANFNPEQQANPAISGIFADPEGDGIFNFLELGFGLHPLERDFDRAPRLEIVETGGQEFLAIRYQRPESMTDVTYTVEISSNLTDWMSTAQDVSEEILETQAGIETIRAQALAPLDGTARFIRIRIEPAP